MLRALVAFTLVLLWTSSCKKSDTISAPAAVNIVHAITNGKPIIPVFSSDPIQYYFAASNISYGATAVYYPASGFQPLYVVKSTDTISRIYSGEVELEESKIYSLFFAGDTSKPESVLVQDEIPAYSDSIAGVRLINLSPASAPIKVNIKGNPASKAEFSNIGYKQISDFKPFTATTAITGNRYIFEIRNQANDSLLLTYTWNYVRYKNNTLVFSGAVNATGKPASLKILSVNNY